MNGLAYVSGELNELSPNENSNNIKTEINLQYTQLNRFKFQSQTYKQKS